MKPITPDDPKASLREIGDLATQFSALELSAHRLSCVAELLCGSADEIQQPETSAFLMFDCLERSRSLLKQAVQLSGAVHKFAATKSTSAPNDALETIITSWRDAHAKWRARLDMGDDSGGPESKAEDFAAEALLTYQCQSHADVQRKVTLFASVDHLGSLGANYPEIFVPSLIVPTGNPN